MTVVVVLGEINDEDPDEDVTIHPFRDGAHSLGTEEVDTGVQKAVHVSTQSSSGLMQTTAPGHCDE